MKTIVTLFLVGFSLGAAAQQLPHTTSYVEKYPDKADQALYIPGTFSQESLPAGLADQLTGKTIQRIDLVYTRFKASPSFNQKALNEARTKQLASFYPEIVSQVKEINWVEQTGATKRSDAAGYFHGFVVYYQEEKAETVEVPDWRNTRDFFSDAGNPGERFQLNASGDTIVTTENGTVIHIPANTIIYANGRPVQGSYDFIYKEYRNPAEIALSGLPMTFNRAGTTYNFNSAGMFEIAASQGNQELFLAQPLTVDFICNEALPELSFYQLEAKTNQWQELHKIDWQQQALDAQNEAFEAGMVVNGALGRPGLLYRIFHPKWGNQQTLIQNGQPVKFSKSSENATLLAEGSDAGHTYPSQVRGLNCSSFGVFNCDQIYRVGNPVAIRPVFMDAENGKRISNAYIACVIDQNINGSFSFGPSLIQCNAASKNIILLFTHDKKVYALEADEFAKLELNKEQVPFPMKDITAHAASSGDLKNYLHL